MFPLILSLLLSHPGHDHLPRPTVLPEEGMYDLYMRLEENTFPNDTVPGDVVYMPMDLHYNKRLERWVVDLPNNAHPMGINDEYGNVTAIWIGYCPDDETVINYVYMDFQVDVDDYKHIWGTVMNISAESCDEDAEIYKQLFYMSAVINEPHSRLVHKR